MCGVRHYVRSVQPGQVWRCTKAKCHIWRCGDWWQLLFSEQFSTQCTRLPPAGCCETPRITGMDPQQIWRHHCILSWKRGSFQFNFFNTMKGRCRKRIQFPTMKHRTQTLSVTSFFMPTHCGWRYYVSDCSVPLLWKLQRSKVLLGNVLNTHLGLFQEFMYWNHHKTHTGKINEAMIFNIQKVK